MSLAPSKKTWILAVLAAMLAVRRRLRQPAGRPDGQRSEPVQPVGRRSDSPAAAWKAGSPTGISGFTSDRRTPHCRFRSSSLPAASVPAAPSSCCTASTPAASRCCRKPWPCPRAGYRAVLVDLRGHGRSTGKYLTYGVQEAQDISQVIDALEQQQLIAGEIGVLGHLLRRDDLDPSRGLRFPRACRRCRRTVRHGAAGNSPFRLSDDARGRLLRLRLAIPADRRPSGGQGRIRSRRLRRRRCHRANLGAGPACCTAPNDWVVPYWNSVALQQAAPDHDRADSDSRRRPHVALVRLRRPRLVTAPSSGSTAGWPPLTQPAACGFACRRTRSAPNHLSSFAATSGLKTAWQSSQLWLSFFIALAAAAGSSPL